MVAKGLHGWQMCVICIIAVPMKLSNIQCAEAGWIHLADILDQEFRAQVEHQCMVVDLFKQNKQKFKFSAGYKHLLSTPNHELKGGFSEQFLERSGLICIHRRCDFA